MGIRTQDVIIEKDKVWYVPISISALVETNQDGKSCILSKLPDCAILDSDMYGSLTKAGNKIYIAPSKGSKFLKMDLLTSKIDELNSGEEWKQNKRVRSFRKFGEAIQIGEEIFFLGVGYPGIAVINIKDDEVSFYEIELNFCSEQNGRYLARSAGVVGSCIYVPLWDTNKVLIFDTKNKKYHVKEIGNSHYVSATYDGEKLWLIPDKMENVTLWNPISDKIEELEILSDNLIAKDIFPFYNGIYQNGYIWIFPMQSNLILKIDVFTNEVVIYDEIKDYCSKKYQYVNAKVMDNDNICGICEFRRSIQIFNTKTGNKEEVALNEIENLDAYIDIEKSEYFIPEDICGLDNYMKMLCAENKIGANVSKSSWVGKYIWSILKNA